MTDCEMTPDDYDTLVEQGYAGSHAMMEHNTFRLANALFDAFKSFPSWTTLEPQAPEPEPHRGYDFDWVEQKPDWPDGSHGRRRALPREVRYDRMYHALQKIERLTRRLSMSDSHDVHAGVTLRAYSIAKEALDG